MSKFSVVTSRGRNCSKCKTFKGWSEFHRAAAHPSGYRSSCKECDKEVVQARLERVKNITLRCNKCGQDKHRDLFNNLTKSRTGKQPHCKQCGIDYYLSKKAERQAAKILATSEPAAEPATPEPAAEPATPEPPESQESPQVHVGPVSSTSRVKLDVVKGDVAYVYDLVISAMRSHRHDVEAMQEYLRAICGFLIRQEYEPK